MFDIGMTELLVIGIVALIVVGPKDLPGMFRTLGRFTGKMRSMAREFQRAMEDAADESGVRDIGRDLKGYSNPKKFGLDKLTEAADSFDKWDPMKEPGKKGSTGRGPATQALSDERREKADKFKKAAGDRAQARLDRQAEAADAPAKDTGTAADTPLTTPEDDKA